MPTTFPYAMTVEASRASMPQPPRKYKVHELLAMGLALPFISCPLNKFTPDAWLYAIIKVYSANSPKVRGIPQAEQDQGRPGQHEYQQGGRRGGGGVGGTPTPAGSGESGGAGGRGGGYVGVTPSRLSPIETPQTHHQLTSPTSASEYRPEYRRHFSSPVAPMRTPMTPMQSHMAPMQTSVTSLGGQISPALEPVAANLDPPRQRILHNIAGFYPQLAEIFAARYPQLQSSTPSQTAQQLQAQQLLAAQQFQATQKFQSPQSPQLRELYPGYPPTQQAMPTFEQRLASMSLEEPKWDASTTPSRPQFGPSGQKLGGRHNPEGQSGTSELVPQHTPKSTGSRDIDRDHQQSNPKNTGSGGTNGSPEPNPKTPRANTGLFQDKANIQVAPATDKGKAKGIPRAVIEEPVTPPPAMLGASSTREHQLAFIEFMKKKSAARSKQPQQLKENMHATPPVVPI